jgi:hypothetical protein
MDERASKQEESDSAGHRARLRKRLLDGGAKVSTIMSSSNIC